MNLDLFRIFNLCKLYSVNSIYQYQDLLKDPDKISHFIKNEFGFIPYF